MKKRVLLVHNFYQTGGGEHTVFNNELGLLEEKGHFVKTYTKDNGSLKKNPLKLLMVPFSTIFSIQTFFQVKKLIREENIEVVHCHNTFPLISPAVYYAAWACKVPVVQTVHNFRFICANGLLYREGKICEDCLCKKGKPIAHGCYRNSKIQTIPVVIMQKLHEKLGTYKRLNYIFLTEFNKDKMLPLLNPTGKVFIKANFVKRIPIIKDMDVDLNKFIFVGRLDEYKGVDFLLDFFATHPQYELCIYGSGNLESAVKSAAQKYSNIKYMGFKPMEDMEEDWQSSCSLIFPSIWYEGLPMTIIESFTLGVPVICTDIGNGSELVKEEYTGAHFLMGDITSLEQAILKVAENRNEYSRNSLQEAQKYYQEENYNQICNIYAKLD